MMETAGERLKKIRLEKGLSLEEVHKKTKIHLSILLAIEGDSLTHLSPVYLQGFIKIYCKFLGLDPKDFMLGGKGAKRKVQETVVPLEAPVKPASAEPQKKNILDVSAKSPAFFNTAAFKLGSFRPSERIKRNIILVLLIIVATVGLFKFGKFISARRRAANLARLSVMPRRTGAGKEQSKQKTVKTSAKTQTQEVKLLAKAAPSNSATQTAAVNNPAKKEDIRLVIKARENSWVTLKTDGKLVFHRVLEKGRSESWKAKDRMDLSLGNAGAVELEVDGQIFSNLGRKGQPLKSIVITQKGMDIGR